MIIFVFMKNIDKAFIYTIINTINNKIYVGSTTRQLWARKSSHYNSLRNNKHCNIYLQRAFNKYGEENFIFELLEETNKEFCLSQELYWINTLNVTNRKFGYNILSNPGNGRRNIKHTQETKDKISEKHLGKKLSKEIRDNMKIAAKLRYIKYGNKAMDSRPSDERIRNMILGRMVKVSKYDINNIFIEEYDSITKASLENNNINIGNISKCCNNKRKTAGKFKWKFNETKQETTTSIQLVIK